MPSLLRRGAAEAYGLHDVALIYGVAAGQVGQGAGDAQDAVVAAGGKRKFFQHSGKSGFGFGFDGGQLVQLGYVEQGITL